MSDQTNELDHRKSACKTFTEQTKLLMSLASAFILAPAVVANFVDFRLTWQIVVAEILFVLSLLASYLTLGALTGTQFKGEFNVYRPAIMWFGRVQFVAYLIGIGLFGWWFIVANPGAP